MDLERLRIVLKGTGITDYPAGSGFGPRLLSDFEFVWIIEGNVEWTVDGSIVAAPPGTVLLGRPGMRDGFRWDPQRLTRHGFVHFDLSGNDTGLPPRDAWPLARQMPAEDILRPLLSHVSWQITRGAATQAQAVAAMRLALAVFLGGEHGTASAAETGEHPAVARAFERVHAGWADGEPVPPTLGDLARAAGVSKVHLTRLFRARFGVPPIEAMRLARLDRAAALLARTAMEVQDVATATGFASPFHFSRAFRAAYGCPPRTFRARILAGGHMPITALMRSCAVDARTQT